LKERPQIKYKTGDKQQESPTPVEHTFRNFAANL
jgi:hypothetical protein